MNRMKRWLFRCRDQTKQRAIEKLEFEYAALLKCSTKRVILGAELLIPGHTRPQHRLCVAVISDEDRVGMSTVGGNECTRSI